MAFQWNAMEFHGIQTIGTLTKLVSGSKQWKSMEFGQQNGCQQKIPEIFWFNNIYSFNQQGKPYIKVSGWQCDYNGVHMCT